MSDDKMWRDLVNSLPVSKVDAPKEISAKKQEVFVQRIVSEIIIYTDLQGNQYASEAFQNIDVLGRMSEKQINKIIKRRRKQQEQSL